MVDEAAAAEDAEAGAEPQISLWGARARVASLNKDMNSARDYFERTAQVARDPKLRAWAHIYLGRISDIQANRSAAVEHYKAALAAGDITPETRAAAERGLQQPYEPRRQ